MPVLLKFTKDYADEFDVHGFNIVSDESWEHYQKEFEVVKFPVKMYFGTNEGIVFEDINDITSSIEAEVITDEEEQLLRKLFNFGDREWAEFGWTPFGNFGEYISDEDYERIHKK